MINSNLILSTGMSYEEAELVKSEHLDGRVSTDENIRSAVEDSYSLIVESIQNNC